MAINQALVPSFVSVVYDSLELVFVDAKFSFNYDNNSGYIETMTTSGKRNYILRKGVSVSQYGDIYMVLAKTPDNKQDESIKFLKDKLKENSKLENPADYCKPIIITAKDPGDEQFMSVSFNGYIAEFKNIPSKDGIDFINYLASFVIFDDLSVKIEN